MAVRLPRKELLGFLEPYGPRIAELALAARAAILKEEPSAIELIYDAYSAVSVAFSYSDRLSDAFCHVAAYTAYVNIGFTSGTFLPDPTHRLQGTGQRIRHVRIAAGPDLRQPDVRALIRAAIVRGREDMAGEPRRPQKALAIVKAIYPRKRRPIRPT